MTKQLEVTTEMFEELAAKVKVLEETLAKSKGQASTREMTDDDAKRVMVGDLAKTSHKAAAEALGLSYGQIYSARGGYTFKHVAKAVNFKAKE